MSRFQCIFLVLVIGVCLPMQPASASKLQVAMDRLSNNVRGYLVEQGESNVSLGDFKGPPGTTAGRAIRDDLERRLKQQNIGVVALGANTEIRGVFELQNGRVTVLVIRADMVDRNGREVGSFRDRVEIEKVTDPEDITRLLGSTVDLRAEQDRAEKASSETVSSSSSNDSNSSNKTAAQDTKTGQGNRDETLTSSSVGKKLRDTTANPSFSLSGAASSVVAADDSSPFKVELLVRRNGETNFKPMPMKNLGGFPFATLSEGDTYQVMVRNSAGHDIGMKLSVDGINCFALSRVPEFRELGTWLVRSGSSARINGWYIDPSLSREFVVSSSGDGTGLPPASDLGTITVQFFHAWGAGAEPPALERGKRNGSQLRTVAGETVEQRSQVSRSFFGTVLLGSVSLRYSQPPPDLPEGTNL